MVGYRHHQVLVVILTGLLAGGCSSAPSPAVEPTPPPDLPRTASVERDGVRVSIELDRNPMPAGEMTWITTRVENIADTDLYWYHGGCPITVDVRGRAEEPWRSGATFAGIAKDLKDFVLRYSRIEDLHASLRFVPDLFHEDTPTICTDNLIVDSIAPGEVVEQRARWFGAAAYDGPLWSGRSGPDLGLPPSGRATITGTAAYLSRLRNDPNYSGEPPHMTVSLDAWISNGRRPSQTDPPEAIDAALANPAFSRWVTPGRVGIGYAGVLYLDRGRDQWVVGLIEEGRGWLAFVDRPTGHFVQASEGGLDELLGGWP
jgi:hypothetical protein